MDSMDSKEDKNTLLTVRNISKSFGSVVALNDVNFEIYRNEVVGIVGDNGAGKSTIIKIISGNYPPDKGEIYFEGKKINFKSPIDARKLGIETVYQDLSLCNNLDSASNLFIGRELYHNIIGFEILDKKKMEKNTIEVLKKIGIKIPSIREKIEYLSGGQRQAVALSRFVAWGKNLALLDEPTAALGIRETEQVLHLINTIRRENISIILISHNLQQVFAVVDRIIVLRLGKVVGIKKVNETTPDEIVSMITGSKFISQTN
jgi:ABC-type sugar transport system ATPase subunit